MDQPKLNWTTALRNAVIGPAAERRREERKYLKVPLAVRLASGTTCSGFSRDLSRCSMGAVVSTELKVGQKVWLTFDYPGKEGEPVHIAELEAVVKQRLGFRYGLEFAPLEM